MKIQNTLNATPWPTIDTAKLRKRIEQEYEQGNPRAPLLAREMYAVTPPVLRTSKNLEQCALPHHIIADDGTMQVSAEGVLAALARLEVLELSPLKKAAALAHLQSHCRLLGISTEAKTTVDDEDARLKLQASKDKQPGAFDKQVFAALKKGAPAATKLHVGFLQATGQRVTDVEAVRKAAFAKNPREDDWPDGMQEGNQFWFGTFRAISAHIVQQCGWWMDFGHKNGKPLRDAMDTIIRRPVLVDHYASARTTIGSVRDALWHDGGDQTIQGEARAPGINVLARINLRTELGRDIAALLDAGDITDVSVGIWFLISKSHPDLDDFDFWVLQGQEVNGEVVRLLVEEVEEIDEMSIVWSGADSHAERIEP